jgi:CHAT domain-containing protein
MNHASRYSLVAIPLLLLVTTPVFAQRSAGGPAPSIDKTNAVRARQQQESRREWQLRNFGRQPNASKDPRQIEALLKQTAEDFDRILTRHNEIARFLAATKPIDYHFVSDASAEIQKRASRLQSTLALHQLPTESAVVEKSGELSEAQIKDELIRMCKQIRSFVTNPVIENPNTVDAQQLTNARRDLERLIQLSAHLKKEAGRLDKNHK